MPPAAARALMLPTPIAAFAPTVRPADGGEDSGGEAGGVAAIDVCDMALRSETEDWESGTEDWESETEDWESETEDWESEELVMEVVDVELFAEVGDVGLAMVGP